jgi:F-type H+-transporting ATPase subunit b
MTRTTFFRTGVALGAAIALAPAALAAEGESFFDSRFWGLVGLAIFIGLVGYAGGWRLIVKALDDRAEGIRRELDEARRLREEAQALRDSFRAREEEARREADQIVAQAKRDADALMAETRASMADTIARRTRAAEDRIARAEAQAAADVRAAAAEAAVAAAERLLVDNLDAKRHKALIDTAGKDMGQRLA